MHPEYRNFFIVSFYFIIFPFQETPYGNLDYTYKFFKELLFCHCVNVSIHLFILFVSGGLKAYVYTKENCFNTKENHVNTKDNCVIKKEDCVDTKKTIVNQRTLVLSARKLVIMLRTLVTNVRWKQSICLVT